MQCRDRDHRISIADSAEECEKDTVNASSRSES